MAHGGPLRYWCCNVSELLVALGAAPSGLKQQEADARLARYGENSVATSQTMTTVRLLLRQFENPLVLILIFGA